MEKRDLAKVLNEFNDEQINILLSKVNSRIKKFGEAVQPMASSGKMIYRGPDYIEKIENPSLDAKVKLFTNYVSMCALDQMIVQQLKKKSGTDKILKSIIEIQKEIFFGKTQMPIHKVYGSENQDDKITYEYMGSGGEYIKKKYEELKNNDSLIIAIRVNNYNGFYYAIQSHMISGLDENNLPEYSEIRMGTNRFPHSFSYIMEGTKTHSYSQTIPKYS